MRRIFPYPLIAIGLFALWLLLNQSLSPGHLVLGAVIGLTLPWAMTLLEPPRVRIRRPTAILRLAMRVLVDIIRSNVIVAGIILGLRRRLRTSGFVEIPLTLRDTNGLAVLACIITSTPGTVWVNFNAPSGVLTIHVLDLVEEAEWVTTIQRRYESLLLEIFT
jgi:multicomponent K+:H+ antiporter subunit E